jgi:peptide/nickel transport system permease protein
VIGKRLPNTLLLAIPSLIVALIVGIPLGVISAQNQSKLSDYLLTAASLFGISVPVFWVAIMLVIIFSVKLNILPSYGIANLRDGFGPFIKHLLMPCFCLAIIPMGTFTRITRSSMIETLSRDYIYALRARGIRGRKVLWKHALKNALPPVMTVIGIQFAGCFAGAILTENIFSWPGMGTMITSAIDNRDYSLIQAAVLVVALAFVLVNLLTDIAYMVLNPKIADDLRREGV